MTLTWYYARIQNKGGHIMGYYSVSLNNVKEVTARNVDKLVGFLLVQNSNGVFIRWKDLHYVNLFCIFKSLLLIYNRNRSGYLEGYFNCYFKSV